MDSKKAALEAVRCLKDLSRYGPEEIAFAVAKIPEDQQNALNRALKRVHDLIDKAPASKPKRRCLQTKATPEEKFRMLLMEIEQSLSGYEADETIQVSVCHY